MENQENISYKKIAVIMAGGVGTRLWPRSTEKCPKQFVNFQGQGSLIQETVKRLKPLFAMEDVYVVTSVMFESLVKDQLPELPPENIILEPLSRHTAPCLALTAAKLKDKYPEDTVMVALPSDHIIHNLYEFYNSIDIAIDVAAKSKNIVTIGITPTRPDTSYGYIQIKERTPDLDEYYNQGVRHSNTFAEKPDVETAKRFLKSGDFLWNSGIFVWRFDTFWKKFEKYLPDHFGLFKLLKRINLQLTDVFETAVNEIYSQMQSLSVDYAILEKTGNFLVVESSFSWSDLGNWDELYRLSRKDAKNNFLQGDVIAVDVSNSFVSSYEKIIGIVGVDDLIVVDSKKALLICKRGHSEDISELLDYMKRKQIKTFI